MEPNHLQIVQKHDSDAISVEGAYGKVTVYESTSLTLGQPILSLAYVIVYRRASSPHLRIAYLSAQNRIQKTSDVDPSEAIKLDGTRLIMMRRKAGLYMAALEFESPLEAKKCHDVLVRVLEYPQNGGSTVHRNSVAGIPPPVATPGSGPPPPAPTQPMPSMPPAAPTPGSSTQFPPPPSAPTGYSAPPPAAPTPGNNTMPPPPAAPTPGSSQLPPMPPAAPTPGGSSRPSSSVGVPPPVATPGSAAIAAGRRFTRTDIPPPVPTPGSQVSGANAANAFPTTPRSGSLTFASNPTGPPPAAPTPGSTAEIWGGGSGRTSSVGGRGSRAGVPPPVKQSHAHGVELPEVTPPTFGAEGWRAGPDLNELRLAVIKAAMADTTSVSTLEKMLVAFSRN